VTAAALVTAVVATALTVAASPDASAAISPTGWNTVVSKHSGKCVDARAAATANGTAVQQQTCNSTNAQQWQFQPTSNGYVRVNALNNAAQALDVTNVSTADSAPVQLWAYGNGLNQQWLPVEESDGAYHLVNRHSGKCLDVPGASTADGLQLQQYTCNGTAAQSFRINPVTGTPRPTRRPVSPTSARTCRSSTRRCRRAPSRPSSTRSSGSRRPTSTANSGTRCCSSRAPTTSAPTSASSPRSPAWA
jgi:hypothetical protein